MAAPKPVALSDHAHAPYVIDARLLMAGAGALLAGAAFYMFARADTPLFLYWIGIEAAPLLSGTHWLPSFIHAVSFTLLSAAFLPPRKLYWAAAALFWFAVNAAFEQIQAVPVTATESGWLPQTLTGYAASGVFDSADLLAASGGAAAGFVICWLVAENRTRGSVRD